MNTTIAENETTVEPTAIKAWAECRTIHIELTDRKTISFPAGRFKLLKKVELRLNGFALRREELEEDITAQGIIAGNF